MNALQLSPRLNIVKANDDIDGSLLRARHLKLIYLIVRVFHAWDCCSQFSRLSRIIFLLLKKLFLKFGWFFPHFFSLSSQVVNDHLDIAVESYSQLLMMAPALFRVPPPK